MNQGWSEKSRKELNLGVCCVLLLLMMMMMMTALNDGA